MHNDRRQKIKTGEVAGYEKAIVMGMFDRDARKVRAKMVPNVKRETLLREISTLSRADQPSTQIKQ